MYKAISCRAVPGEWLALTGDTIGAAEAIAFQLADAYLPASEQGAVWDALAQQTFASGEAVQALCLRTQAQAPGAVRSTADIDRVFGHLRCRP